MASTTKWVVSAMDFIKSQSNGLVMWHDYPQTALTFRYCAASKETDLVSNGLIMLQT